MTERAAVILAAGQGTRMRSPTPKVLHKVGGRMLLDRAIDTARGAGAAARIVVVAGAHSPQVAAQAKARLGEGAVAIQDPPMGTGHAVRAAQRPRFPVSRAMSWSPTPIRLCWTPRPWRRCSRRGPRAPIWRCWASMPRIPPPTVGSCRIAKAVCSRSWRPRTPAPMS